MNLGTLLKRLGAECENPFVEITSVAENVKNVKKGSLFVAVKGHNFDGNDFIAEAFSLGAAAVVTDKDCEKENVIKVSDARCAYAFLCSAFFGDPQDKLRMIAVTGTNGKTTTVEYIKHILRYSGEKCAVIGTLGSRYGEHIRETGFTTPDAAVLFEELAYYADKGIKCVILEVSSQALSQHRADPIVFDIGVFTNIGRDHLDYHGSFENYIQSKLRLARLCKKTLVNADSLFGKVTDCFNSDNCLTYSVKDDYADITAKNVRYSDEYISYLLLYGGILQRVKVKGIGDIALYNSLAAASAALTYGVSADIVSEALGTLPDVKGRMQRISFSGKDIYIDFAHTPEALFSVLSALKKVCKNKLFCVFGCGGDRDKGKRSEMGSVASSLCDFVVITSDNPRSEAPEKIADDILKGIINKKNVFVELDRTLAIEYSLSKAQAGDIVLIAGKGHEEYQITAGEKRYFSDEITVKNILGV